MLEYVTIMIFFFTFYQTISYIIFSENICVQFFRCYSLCILLGIRDFQTASMFGELIV